LIPQKVNGSLQNQTILSIQCGAVHTTVIALDSGFIY